MCHGMFRGGYPRGRDQVIGMQAVEKRREKEFEFRSVQLVLVGGTEPKGPLLIEGTRKNCASLQACAKVALMLESWADSNRSNSPVTPAVSGLSSGGHPGGEVERGEEDSARQSGLIEWMVRPGGELACET